MKRFPLDRNYAKLLESQNISVEEVLRRGMLPEDLFSHKEMGITADEYCRFMKSINESITDNKVPIHLATAEQIETISPPIFASYCSQNGLHCLKRMAQYKSLVGAVGFEIMVKNETVSVVISAVNVDTELPEIIVGIEMVLLLNLIRKATKVDIIPTEIVVEQPFENPEYETFMKKKAVQGECNRLSISMTDAKLPFVSRNDTMWDYFEPELKKRVSEMEIDDTFSSRVRSVLVEQLPGGQTGIDDVCEKLGVSKRTLQRKLSEEGTTFQRQLNHTRELLAKNYYKNTELSSEDIAYLLGYQDINSFFRAFRLWTGKNVTEYKVEI